ncbi:G-protein coupled bile acid receptor 1 isoform X1 [Danio rerio]|uniref:G-protein coupled bile acid receptor 1 isoform X1 n=2 Tax=Danio rerio TaxID=7955 RepID=A0A8M3AWA6_DANRE
MKRMNLYNQSTIRKIVVLPREIKLARPIDCAVPMFSGLTLTADGDGLTIMDPEDKLSREKLIFYLTVPLSSIIIFTNLFIIIGIACNRQLHNTPNYFFLSLLVADLCTGITLPFIPRMSLDRQLDFRHCLVMYIFPNFLFLSFLFNLVMVHYERYLCIVSPLHHSQFWVHRCFPLALLTVWLPPLLYASLPAFGWNNWIEAASNKSLDSNETFWRSQTSHNASKEDEVCSYKQVFPKAFIYVEVCGLVLPAMLCIVCMTGRVLWIARKQLQDICKLHRAVDRLQTSDQEQQLNLRYAKCVAAVSLTFLVCWVPYIIYQLMSVTALQSGVSLPSSSLYIIMSCTGIGSMAVIPLILGLANKQYTEPIRRVMLKLRNRWRRGHSDRDITI